MSYTSQAKNEILSDRHLRSRFRNQLAFGLISFAQRYGQDGVQLSTMESGVARLYASLIPKVIPLQGTITTVETDKRTPGDVIATSTLWETPTVGFMNKCSTTSGITAPLFSTLPMGFGNDAEHGAEGYALGNILATHITGPVLVKNPDFTDLIIQRLFAAKGWSLPEQLPVLPHEREAYAVTLRELQARLK